MNRKTVIVCACFVLLIVAAAIVINGLPPKDAQITELNRQVSELQTQLGTETPQSLDNQITDLHGQINDLQAQLEVEQKAVLVTGLGFSSHAWPKPYVFVEGIVINMGSKTAHNSGVRVIVYDKNGISMAVNVTLPLGDLDKWEIKNISHKIPTDKWLDGCKYNLTAIWTDA